MASHYVAGCDRIRTYRRTQNVDVPDERLCAALGIPIIHMKQNSASFARRVSEAQSEAVADLLGASMADCRTNTGMAIAP